MTDGIITVFLAVVFIGLLYWFAFRSYDPFGAGISKARTNFPETGAALGLEYTPSELREGLGELHGSFGGYRVRVAPDDSALIELVLHERVQVHLSNQEPVRSHTNERMVAFDFNDKSANRLFRTRFASEDLVTRLASSGRIAEFVVAFNGHWGRKKLLIECSNGYVFARFRDGMEKYIPVDDIEPMLKDLVLLASILESL